MTNENYQKEDYQDKKIPYEKTLGLKAPDDMSEKEHIEKLTWEQYARILL